MLSEAQSTGATPVRGAKAESQRRSKQRGKQEQELRKGWGNTEGDQMLSEPTKTGREGQGLED